MSTSAAALLSSHSERAEAAAGFIGRPRTRWRGGRQVELDSSDGDSSDGDSSDGDSDTRSVTSSESEKDTAKAKKEDATKAKK